jgi:hypothetical protein
MPAMTCRPPSQAIAGMAVLSRRVVRVRLTGLLMRESHYAEGFSSLWR